MALDDLLARLERTPALSQAGVSEVSEVQPNNGAGFGCNPKETDEVSEVSGSSAAGALDTPATPVEILGYQAEPLPALGCTLDTRDTSQNDNGQGVTARAWLLHFAGRDPLEVWRSPAVTHAEALAGYPDAVAAEPIPERTTKAATVIETEAVTALIQAVYATDTEADRHEAMQAALADPAGALTCYRAVAAERGAESTQQCAQERTQESAQQSARQSAGKSAQQSAHQSAGCLTCRHRARPGHAEPGYCALRTDQPKAYGADHPLHRLPEDGGADCNLFEGWA